MNTCCIRLNQFYKGLLKGSYNFFKIMGKKFENKNLLVTFKKHPYPKIFEFLKL